MSLLLLDWMDSKNVHQSGHFWLLSLCQISRQYLAMTPWATFFGRGQQCHRGIKYIHQDLSTSGCVGQAVHQDYLCPQVTLLIQHVITQFEIEHGGLDNMTGHNIFSIPSHHDCCTATVGTCNPGSLFISTIINVGIAIGLLVCNPVNQKVARLQQDGVLRISKHEHKQYN